MEIDSFLEDDDFDIEILEVKNNNESVLEEPLPILKKNTLKNNPVEEHLVKQLHCVHNQIYQTKNNIELIESVTEKILENLATQTAYREDVSSESDSDLYSSTGEPFIKKNKNKFYKKREVLHVQKLWQRVIDNKWIIGVVVESETSCVLKDPAIYFCFKGDNENTNGVSIFWTLIDDTFWYPIEEIDSEEQLVATVTLDLPNFDTASYVKAHGVICCKYDDKIFQTKVIDIELSIEDMVNGACVLKFDSVEAQYSILALKAVSIDRIIILPVEPDSNTGKRLMKFLDKYAFKEVCKVCLVKNVGILQYCLLEVLPTDDTDVKILISARSEAQLSIVIQLMQEDFPEILDIEKQQVIDEAAEALSEELQLYLTCSDPSQLQHARIKSDLLIP